MSLLKGILAGAAILGLGLLLGRSTSDDEDLSLAEKISRGSSDAMFGRGRNSVDPGYNVGYNIWSNDDD